MSNKEPGYVYILTNPSFREDWVKIGKSSRPVDDAKKRHFSLYLAKVFVYLQQNNHRNMSNNQQNMMLNRLKAALAEQGKTNRWLSEQLGKSENTISRWCANKVQPSITQLNEIATILDVDVRTLITPTK